MATKRKITKPPTAKQLAARAKFTKMVRARAAAARAAKAKSNARRRPGYLDLAPRGKGSKTARRQMAKRHGKLAGRMLSTPLAKRIKADQQHFGAFRKAKGPGRLPNPVIRSASKPCRNCAGQKVKVSTKGAHCASCGLRVNPGVIRFTEADARRFAGKIKGLEAAPARSRSKSRSTGRRAAPRAKAKRGFKGTVKAIGRNIVRGLGMAHNPKNPRKKGYTPKLFAPGQMVSPRGWVRGTGGIVAPDKKGRVLEVGRTRGRVLVDYGGKKKYWQDTSNLIRHGKARRLPGYLDLAPRGKGSKAQRKRRSYLPLAVNPGRKAYRRATGQKQPWQLITHRTSQGNIFQVRGGKFGKGGSRFFSKKSAALTHAKRAHPTPRVKWNPGRQHLAGLPMKYQRMYEHVLESEREAGTPTQEAKSYAAATVWKQAQKSNPRLVATNPFFFGFRKHKGRVTVGGRRGGGSLQVSAFTKRGLKRKKRRAAKKLGKIFNPIFDTGPARRSLATYLRGERKAGRRGMAKAALGQWKRQRAIPRKTWRAPMKPRRFNPRASEVYNQFRGKEVTRKTRVTAASGTPSPLAKLGGLVELKIRGRVLRFNQSRVALAADSRKRLHITGARFQVRGNPEGEVDMGEVLSVTYRADKPHIEEGVFNYVHKFGEEGGTRPHLIIDEEGYPKLEGGSYGITEDGIID